MSFLPAALKATLTGWYDVSSCPREDGNTIGTLYDLSGSRNDMNASLGALPTYKANQINGHPALLFDGATTELHTTKLYSSLMPSNLTGTVITVFKATSIATNNANAFDNDPIWAEQTAALSGGSATLKSAGAAYSVFNDGAAEAASRTYVAGQWAIHVWRHNSTIIDSGINDENNMGTFTSAGTGQLTPLTGTFGIGVNCKGAGGVTPRWLTGYVAECMVWSNVLSTLQLAQALNYLRAKYFSNNSTIQTRLTRADALEQTRDVASRELWYARQPYGQFPLVVPLVGLDIDVVTDLAIATPLGPDPNAAGGGWPNATWARRHLRAYEVSIDLDKLDNARLAVTDLRTIAHTFQCSETAIRATCPQRQGVMSSSAGAVRLFGRPSDAWIEDPSSRAIVLVTEGQEKVAYGGTLLEGSLTNYLLRSSFVTTSSGLTGPAAQAGATASTVTTTPAGMLFDAAVSANAFKIIGPNPSTSGAAFMVTWPATISLVGLVVSPAIPFVLNIDRSDAATSATMSYTLQRASDSQYFNASSSWGSVAVVYNAITASTAANVIGRFTQAISAPGTTASTPSLTLAIGCSSGGNLPGKTTYLYHVELVGRPDATSSGTISAPDLEPVFPTSRIVTDASRYTRFSDSLWFFDASADATGIAPNTVGVVRFIYTPQYAAADIPAGKTVTIFRTGTGIASGTADYFTLVYDKTSGTLQVITNRGGVTSTASVSWTPVRGTAYKIAVRYTSSSAELGLTSTMSVFVAGVKGTDAALPAGATMAGAPFYWSDGTGAGSMLVNPLVPWGQIASVECIPYALTDQEIGAW